jgi:hypothetical protein
MGDVMEAAKPAKVTNTDTAVMAYPVEAAMEAVSTTVTAVSTMTAVSAAMTTASDCDGRRESCRNDRDRDGKGDGRFSKHRSVSSVGHPPRRDASAGG